MKYTRTCDECGSPFLRVHPRCSPFAPNVPTDYTVIRNAGMNLKTAGAFFADGMAE